MQVSYLSMESDHWGKRTLKGSSRGTLVLHVLISHVRNKLMNMTTF